MTIARMQKLSGKRCQTDFCVYATSRSMCSFLNFDDENALNFCWRQDVRFWTRQSDPALRHTPAASRPPPEPGMGCHKQPWQAASSVPRCGEGFRCCPYLM